MTRSLPVSRPSSAMLLWTQASTNGSVRLTAPCALKLLSTIVLVSRQTSSLSGALVMTTMSVFVGYDTVLATTWGTMEAQSSRVQAYVRRL